VQLKQTEEFRHGVFQQFLLENGARFWDAHGGASEKRGRMHTTSATLLERLRGPMDPAAWDRFVRLYAPLLHAWAARVCKGEQEADDLVQEVFTVLVRKLPEFRRDPAKSFRGWLLTIVMNKRRDWARRRKLATVPLDDAASAALTANDLAVFEDREYRQHLVNRALELMRAEFQPAHWQACWEHVANGKTAAQVAAESGTSVATVYAATSRVMRRLREALGGLLD
jgi:RNA polymerase sigma-70 factor (ECF subfamily)